MLERESCLAKEILSSSKYATGEADIWDAEEISPWLWKYFRIYARMAPVEFYFPHWGMAIVVAISVLAKNLGTRRKTSLRIPKWSHTQFTVVPIVAIQFTVQFTDGRKNGKHGRAHFSDADFILHICTKVTTNGNDPV